MDQGRSWGGDRTSPPGAHAGPGGLSVAFALGLAGWAIMPLAGTFGCGRIGYDPLPVGDGDSSSSDGPSSSDASSSLGASTACTSDAVCAPPTPYCNPATSVCVECLSDTNCAGTREPHCSATNSCVALPCAGDAQCASGQPCRTNADCGGAGFCDTRTNTCSGSAACTSNAQCGGTTPICDTARSSCVECLSNADCSGAFRGGGFCNQNHVCQ